MIFFESLSKSAASDWLIASEIGVLAFSLILAVGLAGEFPEANNWRSRPWYVAAKCAVIVGVLGEFLSDGTIYGSSARISQIQETELSAARSGITKLLDANDLLKKSSDALSVALDTERAARIKIAANLTDRSLTDAQAKDFDARLARFKGTAVDVFIFPDGSGDALPLAYKLANELNGGAHWKALVWDTTGPTLLVKGVVVVVRAGANAGTEEAAEELVRTLQAENLGAALSWPFKGGAQYAALQTGPSTPASADVRLLIGRKPE
ncbi:MAG: hypothetical protein WBQ17_00980 [Rhizomicrobium sp.]